MRKYLLLPFLLLLSETYGFSTPDTSKNTLVFEKFPVEQIVKTTRLFRLQEKEPYNICLLKDSIMLVRDAADEKKYHFSFYNIKNRKLILHALKFGGKRGQSPGFMGNSYGIIKKTLWVHSVGVGDKFLIADIDSILNHKPVFFEFKVEPFFYTAALIDSQTAVVTDGEYDSPYKLQLWDLPAQKMIRPLTSYPQEFTRAQRSSYEGFVFIHPSGTKCVLAARYADRIEIFDLESGEERVVKGPENYEPMMKAFKDSHGRERSGRSSKTRFSFRKCKTTEKHIYLLYSGSNHLAAHASKGKYIYVYDWEGNPVKKVIFKNYIQDFAVSADESKLYVYNPQTRYIETTKL